MHSAFKRLVVYPFDSPGYQAIGSGAPGAMYMMGYKDVSASMSARQSSRTHAFRREILRGVGCREVGILQTDMLILRPGQKGSPCSDQSYRQATSKDMREDKTAETSEASERQAPKNLSHAPRTMNPADPRYLARVPTGNLCTADFLRKLSQELLLKLQYLLFTQQHQRKRV